VLQEGVQEVQAVHEVHRVLPVRSVRTSLSANSALSKAAPSALNKAAPSAQSKAAPSALNKPAPLTLHKSATTTPLAAPCLRARVRHLRGNEGHDLGHGPGQDLHGGNFERVRALALLEDAVGVAQKQGVAQTTGVAQTQGASTQRHPVPTWRPTSVTEALPLPVVRVCAPGCCGSGLPGCTHMHAQEHAYRVDDGRALANTCGTRTNACGDEANACGAGANACGAGAMVKAGFFDLSAASCVQAFGSVPAFAVRERIAYVYSNHRFYNASTGVLHVPVNLRNCIGFELVEASVTRTHYTIQAPHNALTVHTSADGTALSASYALTIPAKDYTATQLKDQLATLLSAGVSGVTATVDAQTKKFAFNAPVGTQYLALEFADRHLAYILGFTHPSAYTGPASADGTDRFDDADLHALYYPKRTTALTTVAYANAYASSMSSSGQHDLSGNRYLRLECPLLQHAYSNSGVIKDLPFADDVTFTSQADPSFMRKFVDPMDLTRLRVNVQVLTPDGGAVTFNNYGLAFHLTFAATTLLRARGRTEDGFVD